MSSNKCNRVAVRNNKRNLKRMKSMFGQNRKIIYGIIIAMAVITLLNYATSDGAILSLLLTLPGVLLAITFHEFAHANAADKLGDDTPRMQGRLTLNPKDHIDPLGILMLMFVHVGWGKPVQVNPRNYDRRFTMEKADAIVSIAGPLMNFFLSVVLTLIYCAIVKFAPATFYASTAGIVTLSIIFNAIIVNVGLGVFNLIPLPPLDGSKVFLPILPSKAKYWFIDNQQIFYIVFLVLWVTGLAGTFISPIISTIATQILSFGQFIFGL